ncbi:MAG: DUF664 domain-containing protein [Armatimonadia bacterium]|nr:DUF664 domain-containing protein [Armatimonadia bacterium]
MGFDVEHAISRLDEVRGFCLRMLKEMPEDKMDWRPPIDGADPTNISEQIKHSLDVEHGMASHMLAGESMEAPDSGHDYFASSTWAQVGPAAELKARDDLMAAIQETAQRTTELLRKQPSDGWDVEIDAGFAKKTKAGFIDMLIDHWWYHVGQIGYIQRLYGDMSFG